MISTPFMSHETSAHVPHFQTPARVHVEVKTDTLSETLNFCFIRPILQLALAYSGKVVLKGEVSGDFTGQQRKRGQYVYFCWNPNHLGQSHYSAIKGLLL